MTAVSALRPGSAKRVVLGSRSCPAPKMIASGVRADEARFQLVAQRRHMHPVDGEVPQRRRSGHAETRDARNVFGSGAGPALLPAAADQRFEVKRRVTLDEGAGTLRGRRSCARKW